ncbi:MAG: ATP-binding protein [Chloroflexi bacterium]|nr:ATP-binding protein [Chloroflexota bacterium]
MRAEAEVTAPRRARLYVLVGLPGSGKTTYARTRLPLALRVSLDDLRQMLTNRDYVAELEGVVHAGGRALLDAVAREAAKTGTDVVFDATNLTRERRALPIEVARRHGLSPVAVWVTSAVSAALARNAARKRHVPEDVIARFAAGLEPPSLDEGFEEVIRTEDEPG